MSPMKDALREHGLYYAVIAVVALLILSGLVLLSGLSLRQLVLCAVLVGVGCTWAQMAVEK